MKKTLLFLFALLGLGVSGAWAATPATGAYPVSGKTYYLYAIQTDGSRSYLYSNDGTLAVSNNSKENADKYKWMVSVSGSDYQITNAAGNSLSFTSSTNSLGLYSNVANFSLSQTVTYTACVSIYNSSYGWFVAPHDSQNMPNNYRISSFSTNDSWSPNFVFEEVLDAHSLTNGAYYTIYCDNDDKQYLYDNGGTLSIASEASSEDGYVWQCIVNTVDENTYYNFRNLLTGKYLGWQALSATAYNFNVETTNAKHDGCAPMWGVNSGKYLLIKNNNSFDQATGAYDKVTTDYSSDYRFDAVVPTSITDLSSLSNSKAYMIANARAAWRFADNATSMTAQGTGAYLRDAANQIAIIQKDSKYYLFSVNANKYLTASNTLTNLPSDNEQVTISATGSSSYPWFFRFENYTDENSKYTKNINIDGDYNVTIDGWGPNGSNTYGEIDKGNSNFIIEAVDFDAAEALNMFNQKTVTYNLSYDGNATFKTQSVTTYVGASAADFLPSGWNIDYVTLSYDVENITDETTTVNVTATWDGPFEISTDFASAKWYYMTLRGYWVLYYETTPWVMTSTQSKADAAQWAFIGNPYEGFQIVNKEKGVGYNLYTNGTAGSYPDMSDTNISYWRAQQHPAEGLNFITGTNSNLYAGSYNGGQCVQIWNGTLTSSNDGTAKGGSLTFDAVPNNFYSYYATNVKPYFDQTGYFYISTSAADYATKKAANDSYVEAESCTQNQYEEMLAYVTDAANYNYPPTGYYRLKNYNQYDTGNYYYLNASASALNATTGNTSASTIVYLVKNNDNTYTMQMQGQYVQTPAEGTNSSISSNSVTFTPTVGAAGWASFNAGGAAKGNLHMNSSKYIVGWDATGISNNAASYWAVEDATTFTGTLTDAKDNTSAAHSYASLCVPFNITNISGASAYTLTLGESGLDLSEGSTTVAAGTPVMLVGEENAGTYTATIGSTYVTDPVEFTGSNVLSGTFTGTSLDCTADTGTNYVLGFDEEKDNRIGFYHVNNTAFPLSANRAYFAPAQEEGSVVIGVKGFAINFDTETGIEAIADETSTLPVYNLAGQRVEKATRGLYIVGGKKVVVK